MQNEIIYNDSNTNILFANFETIEKKLADRKCFLIIDENVNNLYPQQFQSHSKYILHSSENNKSLTSYSECVSILTKKKFDKDIIIVGVGGGVVCDFAGFVASTYKRGTRLVLIPTTFLAQIDAAIGGKNGLNFDKIKNLIGNFKLPGFIFINTDFLSTLSKEEFINGIAEAIKISLVYDSKLFEFLESSMDTDLRNNTPHLQKIISRCIRNKMDIVNDDLYDTGLRRILNAGHTIGHAIEAVHGFSHGVSVAMGLSVMVSLSLKYKMVNEKTAERIYSILIRYGFIFKHYYDSDLLMKFILQDKKMKNKVINEILIRDIGKYEFKEIPVNNYINILNDLR